MGCLWLKMKKWDCYLISGPNPEWNIWKNERAKSSQNRPKSSTMKSKYSTPMNSPWRNSKWGTSKKKLSLMLRKTLKSRKKSRLLRCRTLSSKIWSQKKTKKQRLCMVATKMFPMQCLKRRPGKWIKGTRLRGSTVPWIKFSSKPTRNMTSSWIIQFGSSSRIWSSVPKKSKNCSNFNRVHRILQKGQFQGIKEMKVLRNCSKSNSKYKWRRVPCNLSKNRYPSLNTGQNSWLLLKTIRSSLWSEKQDQAKQHSYHSIFIKMAIPRQEKSGAPNPEE